MNRPALRAGLIGAAAAVVISLLGLIPAFGCLSLPLEWLIFLGAGVLAAYWMIPPRQTGRAAGEGALAGLIASVLDGLVNMLLAPLSLRLSGGASQILSQLPPEQLQVLRDAGIDPNVFVSTGAVLGYGAVCCGVGIVIALLLGALGGLIFAAAKPE